MKIIDEYGGTYIMVPFSEVITGTTFYTNYHYWLKTEDENTALNLENGISYCFSPNTLVQIFPNAELVIK